MGWSWRRNYSYFLAFALFGVMTALGAGAASVDDPYADLTEADIRLTLADRGVPFADSSSRSELIRLLGESDTATPKPRRASGEGHTLKVLYCSG